MPAPLPFPVPLGFLSRVGADEPGCSHQDTIRGSASRSTGARACGRTHKLDDVLGEREAVVVELKPFGLHGVTYYDVTVQFSDRTLEHARLGPEAVPDALQPGEGVMV